MKKVLLGVAVVIVVGLLGVVAVASTKPATFSLERSLVIGAPAAVVYENLEDFHRWSQWSPWEKLDPQLTRTFSGEPKGKGAVYDWSGNKEAGRGRMTMQDTRAPELVDIRLQFFEPFEGDNRTLFTLAPAGEGTQVTWNMSGPNSFMGKVISVFADMDKMVGKDFERGLQNLKQISEAHTAVAAH